MRAIHIAIILLAIFALYSVSLGELYLFADEMGAFRKHSLYYDTLKASRNLGRPISGVSYVVISKFIMFDEYGLQALRVMQFILSFIMAIITYFVLIEIKIPDNISIIIVIFLWSQPAFAIFHLYFYLIPYWIGIYASLLAYALFLTRQDKPFLWPEAAVCFALFMLGFGTFQMTPFFFLGFMAFSLLKDRGGVYQRRHYKLFAVLITATIVYTIAFKVGTRFLGGGDYVHAQRIINPGGIGDFLSLGYLYVFEFWNYPIPIELDEKTKIGMLSLAAFVWILLVGYVAVSEVWKDRQIYRWALVSACIGATFLPVAADGGSGRQHLFLAALPALILPAYYASTKIFSETWKVRAQPFLIGCVALILAGGSLGYQRALVDPAARLFTFVQVEAVNQSDRNFNQVAVILPNDDVFKTICKAEPCSSFYGRRMATQFHLRRRWLYLTVLRFVGQPADVPVIIMDNDSTLPTDATVINWNRFLDYERRRSR